MRSTRGGVLNARLNRRMALITALGGLLWVPYGVFEMLQPWGEDTDYRDDRGYEVVTDILLYRVYGLPGSAALLLTALGLIWVFRVFGLPADRAGRTGLVLAYAALALAVLSAIGLVIRFDPLFTAPRIFGTLALGGATLLAGVATRRIGLARGWAVGLLALGLLGLFLLPLWPLVYAVELVPEGGGVGIIALFGLGWALVGYGLWSGRGEEPTRDVRGPAGP
ncbi:MAG: hypothetical protein AVDCRST_MAG73-2767 [uncultured Thermomicrobiales bacterium]|uniref:DUF998 domain-containing protein n=1 Tax=uncultured Thermomicrobiales bacterium TaxID=1645740 RepID=A0A6J4UHS3_9BACT|nr:MAG: hypothetical protein AVDCRST_MAG73-2767 [uncultured Thermomicrobiales bacterium]